jgi:serine/threonine protein kinase/predicted Zn-dependent protease
MIGKTISHYRILEKIGAGGMGVVYKAEDTRLKRPVALKFLPPELTKDKEARKRFYREAQAASALQHQNICAIHDIEETADGQVFMCLDCYNGQTLKEKLAALPAGKPLPIDETTTIIRQVAAGLQEAHEQGIVHRDLKPANIFITADGVVKILDFGLAKLASASRLTRTGMVSGTAAYMSPEQALGKDVDQRSDIWSLGVILYEMLAGRHPFAGDYEQALIYQILNQEPEALAAPGRELPEKLIRVVNGCLQKDRGKRIQDAGKVLKLLADAPRPEKAPGPRTKFSKKLWAALAAGLVVAGAAFFFFVLNKGPALSLNAKTIAVLPFIDLSNDPANAYFSDGVTEDILTQLSRLSDLRVISRTTMMQYKGTKKKMSEIGAELKAGVVLEGSVRRSGNRVRIVAQLIEAQRDAHLWADSYDRDLSDILAIQADVAANIASALKAALSLREKQGLANAKKIDPRVYSLLLQGRFFMQQGNREGVDKAIALFEQALAIAPDNALLWAKLASARNRKLRSFSSPSSPGEQVNFKQQMAQVRRDAEKALELDKDCVIARRVIAMIRIVIDLDWRDAEVEIKRAMAIDPNDVDNISFMVFMASRQGRWAEALALIRKAIELDPTSAGWRMNEGVSYFALDKYEQALASMSKALELHPQREQVHMARGMVFMLMGKPDQAIEEMRLEQRPDWRCYGLALAYSTARRDKEADAALAELIDKHRSYSQFQIAEVYAWRGQADQAFAWLDEAVRAYDPGITRLYISRWFGPLKSDPRYAHYLKKLNQDF